MRETIENKDADSGVDAASLTRIKLRRTGDAIPAASKKIKSGDITDRLQALAEELEASKPAFPAPKHAFNSNVTDPADKQKLAPKPRKAKPKPAQKAVHTKKQPLEAKLLAPAPAPAEKIVAPTPPSAVPPRRARWARPTAGQGWQKKTVAPDILTYWMEIRNGNRYPNWQNLDTRKIGKLWPNCALVHCDQASGRLQLERGFAAELRLAMKQENPLSEFSTDIDFSPMVVDWILGLARDVANSGKPTHGTEYFPSTFDEIPLRVIALPLSENQVDIDHVLCYVQKLS